jgi:hypothetical protein
MLSKARIGITLLSLVVLAGSAGLHSSAAAASAPTLVTNDNDGATSYLRYDGTSDATTTACSSGRRSQNEPTVAVNPRNTDIVVAGSNDYCAQIVNGDVWTGFYRSTNGGATWANSLVPGYPDDTSAAGAASPTHGVCSAAGDPTQSFDTESRLFYGFICFNRAQPTNGSVYVATYTNDGGTYVRTVRVDRGTPSTWGLFQDKINVATDQTGGPHSDNVYVAWATYPGQSANNRMMFARSTDHGVTYSKPIAVDKGLSEKQFADLAVGPDGAVYLTYRTIAHQSSTANAVYVAKSTDGGASFGSPVRVAGFTPFEGADYGSGAGCGDGPFACATGFTYSRFSSLSAVAADDSGVHVVWNGRNAGGQAKVYVSNSADGVQWSAPATVDTAAEGHQWFPDVASADGVISVVLYDSRRDPSYAPDVPPGNTGGGVNSGNVVDTRIAQSTDGGNTWTEQVVSNIGSNFGWETHSSRRLGFWGDYNYISAVPGGVYTVWTSSQDVVPGPDPRETGADDDEDLFDVYQPCTYAPNDINAPSYTSPTIDDSCLSQGGLDQNIYGTSP